jgi:tRNA (cmo5U34)-methyltransferase
MTQTKKNYVEGDPQKWIPEHWTFDSAAVAARFDQHVREQLPWYDHLLDCIVHFGAHYIQEKGWVYDVGASTGNVGVRLAPYMCERGAHLVAIERSPDMARKWQPPPGVAFDNFKLLVEDVRTAEIGNFDFCVVNLVLMFLPSPDRANLVRKLVELVNPGGALVIVDKVNSPPGYLGTVFRRMAMKWKLAAGATAEEIVAKELSLGGVQRPISPAIIPANATRFFQFGEFVGWIYEREERGTG